MALQHDTAGYSPARAGQVRILLWVAVAVSVLTVLAGVLVLPARLAFFAGVPAVAAVATGALALRRLSARRPAKVAAGLTGGLVSLVGLLTALLPLGFVVIVVGVLMCLVALMPEPHDGGASS